MANGRAGRARSTRRLSAVIERIRQGGGQVVRITRNGHLIVQGPGGRCTISVPRDSAKGASIRVNAGTLRRVGINYVA